MRVAQQTAVVSGAAGGIGLALCRELMRRGAGAVGMVDVAPGVSEAAAELRREYEQCRVLDFQGDAGDPQFRSSVFDDMQREAGLVRICLPCAGITRDKLAVKVDRESGKSRIYPVESFREVLEVNLLAPVYWTLEMIARILEDRKAKGLGKWQPEEDPQGVAVFFGSVSSLGNPGQLSYAASKAALEGAAATLRMECARNGMRCVVLHPGYTDTGMVRAVGEEIINEYILPATQLGRLIQPREIAEACCFLVENAAVTGSLWADAGWHPRPC